MGTDGEAHASWTDFRGRPGANTAEPGRLRPHDLLSLTWSLRFALAWGRPVEQFCG